MSMLSDDYITDGLDVTVDNQVLHVSAGSSGVYTISGTNGTSALDWSNISVSNTYTSSINKSGMLELRGEKADIVVNGQSLMTMMQQIQERLNILTVNTDLETEWDELRELGRRYRELEQHIRDKMAVWQKLNAQDQSNL
jgi:hypothetical protein